MLRRSLLALLLVCACSSKPAPRTSLDAEPARMVSAFFGLDNALPQIARLICFSAPGQDGMPVTFSRRVIGDISPKSFSIKTQKGVIHHPICATLKPANASAKRHTVLLIGEFGHAAEDPPESLEITGDLMLEGRANARGLSQKVTPLSEGPTLALALLFEAGVIDSDCPPATRRIVSVVWTGGVKPGPGFDATHHLTGYRLKTKSGALALGLGRHRRPRQLCASLSRRRGNPPRGIFCAGHIG